MSYVHAKLQNHKLCRLGVRRVLVLRQAAGTAFPVKPVPFRAALTAEAGTCMWETGTSIGETGTCAGKLVPV